MAGRYEKEFRKALGLQEHIVYHYCSLDSLYGIITSKSLWLTSLTSTNDKKELGIANSVVHEALRSMLDNEKYCDHKSFIRKVTEVPAKTEFMQHKRPIHYYGASFVDKKDSLIHWDRYGQQGQGICVAFNLWMIQHFFENYALPLICRTWLWNDNIIYNPKEQCSYIENRLFEIINTPLSRILSEERVSLAAYNTLIKEAKPKFKHIGFADEAEHRLVLEEGGAEETYKALMQTREREIDKTELLKNVTNHIYDAMVQLGVRIQDKKFAKIGQSIRSYYALNLDEIWGDALIPEIIIGPKCYQNKNELLNFIKHNGLSGAKVSISKIPMR